MKEKLKIDAEFMKMSIPISIDEQRALEKSLISEGCLEPIYTWNGFVLDGYKRFDFCNNEGIDYRVQEMNFSFRERAQCHRSKGNIVLEKKQLYGYVKSVCVKLM